MTIWATLQIYKNMNYLPSYTNTEAHNLLKDFMRLKMPLDIEMQDKPFVNICTQGLSKFHYLINNESWQWIVKYLNTGEYDDYRINPQANNIQGTNIQAVILEQLVSQKANIIRVPFIRDYTMIIPLVALFPFGKLLFKIRRSNQFMDFLSNYDL